MLEATIAPATMIETLHPMPDTEIVAGRHGVLRAACADKVVLHVGCVDSGLTRERFARGELLHQQLGRVARELWGTDIDGEGVRFLESRGVERLFLGDLSSGVPLPALEQTPFDVIVLGEVLEHMPNPGRMLTSVRTMMRPGKTLLIVTVPNAFALSGLLSLVRGVESVHPDHTANFSRTTLLTLLTKTGLAVVKEYVYVFDVEYLPAQRLKQTRFYDAAGRRQSRQMASATRRLLGRIRHRHPSQIPAEFAKTLLAAILYRRTPYWADGLVAFCVRHDDSHLERWRETYR